MISRINLNTLLLCAAMCFSLSFFGFVGFGYKLIGDGILLYIAITCLRRGMPVRFVAIRYLSLVAILFVMLLMMYSIYLWGDVFSAFQYGRRWLIFSILLFIASFDLNSLLNRRILSAFFIFGFSASCLAMILYILGFNIAGVASSQEIQGEVSIRKIFSAGIVFVFCGTVYSILMLINKPSLGSLLNAIISCIIFASVIKFRGFYLAMMISLSLHAITQAGGSLYRPWLANIKSLSFIIYAAIFLLIGYSFSPVRDKMDEFYYNQYRWITSAATDYTYSTGNINYRKEKDFYRIESVKQMNSQMYDYLGVGFIGSRSKGYDFFGFSSETSDTGVVEIQLTGGYLAIVLFSSIFFMVLCTVIIDNKVLPNIYKSCFVVMWIVMALTMWTSNMMLWDFGFTPILLLMILGGLNERTPS